MWKLESIKNSENSIYELITHTYLYFQLVVVRTYKNKSIEIVYYRERERESTNSLFNCDFVSISFHNVDE
ncbi:hypothetical protein QVD17_21250 [Tagetes erecta]|uniref:Uncharacterized protein n=1 Tax=Tagetes erecta TaxID=13708 RepID=A0AAD8KQN3_TARER|nr:hypothetical protein QVD17_21250 [Tagetes erecta]